MCVRHWPLVHTRKYTEGERDTERKRKWLGYKTQSKASEAHTRITGVKPEKGFLSYTHTHIYSTTSTCLFAALVLCNKVISMAYEPATKCRGFLLLQPEGGGQGTLLRHP